LTMPSESELAPHVEELARALQGHVQPETIRGELERYLAHGVPLHQAKRDILTSLGGGRPLRKKIKAVTVTDQAVDLLAKVVTVNEREITARGEPTTIWSGLLGDETGVIPYTAWRDVGLSAGQVLLVSNAYITTWQGNPQVNLGDRTEVAPSDEEIDVPPPARRGLRCVIKELAPGMNSVTVKGRVLSVEQRTIEVRDEPRTLWEGELADATGRVPYTAWHDHGLNAGTNVQIENAYVRSFRGIASLNFGENSEVTTLADGELPTADELALAKSYTLEELERSGGALGVEVNGVILEIKSGSGLIHRCPECRRMLQRGECRLHGRVEGIADLRIKAVLDDGTGAATALFNRPLTEEVLSMTLEECQAASNEAMSTEVIADEVAVKLLCKRVTVEGNASRDDFGTTLLVNAYRVTGVDDLAAKAEALLDRVHAQPQEVRP